MVSQHSEFCFYAVVRFAVVLLGFESVMFMLILRVFVYSAPVLLTAKVIVLFECVYAVFGLELSTVRFLTEWSVAVSGIVIVNVSSSPSYEIFHFYSTIGFLY